MTIFAEASSTLTSSESLLRWDEDVHQLNKPLPGDQAEGSFAALRPQLRICAVRVQAAGCLLSIHSADMSWDENGFGAINGANVLQALAHWHAI